MEFQKTIKKIKNTNNIIYILYEGKEWNDIKRNLRSPL